MLNKALYLKYSSSQNYFFTKDINEFVESSNKEHVVRFKDNVIFEEEEDYIIEYFQDQDIPSKLQFLSEYYKYHNEIPRFFQKPHNHILNKFYDKKRRINYYKIKNILNQQR